MTIVIPNLGSKKSAHVGRNNIIGTTRQRTKVDRRPKADSPESGQSHHLCEFSLRLLDRYLATKAGSVEARVAMDLLNQHNAVKQFVK